MSWFSQRYEDYEDEVRRLQALEADAGRLFDELWTEVLSISAEAQASGVTLEKTESPTERTLTTASSPDPNSGAGKKLILRLELVPGQSAGKRAVTADAGSGVQDFPFAVDAKYKVDLTLNNEVQSPPEAAEKIMESFLFHNDGPFALLVKRVE
jgi:hypothetical protein